MQTSLANTRDSSKSSHTRNGRQEKVKRSQDKIRDNSREREAQRLYNRSFQSMLEEKEKNQFSKDEKLNEQIEAIKKLYPMKLSEAEPDKS